MNPEYGQYGRLTDHNTPAFDLDELSSDLPPTIDSPDSFNALPSNLVFALAAHEDPETSRLAWEAYRSRAHRLDLLSRYVPEHDPISPMLPETATTGEYITMLRGHNTGASIETDVEYEYTATKLKSAMARLLRPHTEGNGRIDAMYTQLGLEQSALRRRQLVQFYDKNFQVAVLGPRLAAYQRAAQARDAYMAEALLVPPDSYKQHNIREYVSCSAVDENGVRALVDRVKQAPFATTVPDFLQLPPTRQNEVAESICQEVDAMFMLLIHSLPRSATGRNEIDAFIANGSIRHGAPLAYAPLDVMRQALQRRQGHMPVQELWGAFMRRNWNVDQWAERSRPLIVNRATVLRDRLVMPSEPAPAEAAHQRGARTAEFLPSPTVNQQEIQKLLNDPEIDPAILDLAPRQSLQLMQPDARLSGKAFDAFVDKYVQLIGRAIYEGLDGVDDITPSFLRWNMIDMGNLLRDNSAAAMLGLTVMRIAVDQRSIQEQLLSGMQPSRMAPNVAHLVFTGDIKSSGRPPMPTYASVYVAAALRNTGRGVIFKSRRGLPAATGKAAVEALTKVAVAQSRQVYVDRLANPLATGIRS